jgi:hypothetical protein
MADNEFPPALPMLSGPPDRMRLGLGSFEGSYGVAPHPVQNMVR